MTFDREDPRTGRKIAPLLFWPSWIPYQILSKPVFRGQMLMTNHLSVGSLVAGRNVQRCW